MIGQSNLIRTIKQQIQEQSFPRFSIFVGESGSEKNEFAKYVATMLGANFVNLADCKVDTIRDMIADAYKIKTPTVYGINDADGMSIQAKNSLLKVTEEPPNKAYFVMTLESVDNTLRTIQSRGAVYRLELYSSDELRACIHDRANMDIILELCSTPGDIEILESYGVTDFCSFVEKVINNIATVGGSNAFKIGQKIRFKDTDEGYDLRLFWKAFVVICFKCNLYDGVRITSRSLAKLRTKTINRAMLFDSWLLDIRQIWR